MAENSLYPYNVNADEIFMLTFMLKWNNLRQRLNQCQSYKDF